MNSSTYSSLYLSKRCGEKYTSSNAVMWDFFVENCLVLGDSTVIGDII